MCVKPTLIYVEGKPSLKPRAVPCRKCWACTKNRVNSLVAKCLMQQSTSEWAYVLTLTYDDRRLLNHDWGYDAKKYICKADFQEFMRNVRSQMRSQDRKNKANRGSDARYLCAGEYGELKGRSHFHVLLMGTGTPPPIPKLKKNYQYMDAWPWGFTYAEIAIGERPIRYIAKYLVKAISEKEKQKTNPTSQAWVTYSRLPPMGSEYVQQMARLQADAQIMPYDLKFTPPAGTTQNSYSLTGKHEEIFFDSLYDAWPAMLSKPCHEWIYNARLRWIKKKALDRWDNFTVETKYELLNEAMNLSYRPSPSIIDHDGDDREQNWFRTWLLAEIRKIEETPPLYGNQHAQELRLLFASVNRRIFARPM